MAKIFTKPNDYEKWLTSGVSQVNWPKECRRYHINLLKFKLKHPEAADMTPEQLDEYRAKLRAEASDKRQAAINAKLEAMTPEEREAYQKKKGSFYQKMTPEEKAAHNEVLRKRSQNFWDGMTAEEKAEFGKYRESKWTEEQKAERLQRWQEGSQRWREEHPDEQKAISTMGHAVYMEKFNSDPEFRERQIALLRKHNEEFFNAMSREEREEWYHKNAMARYEAKTPEEKRRLGEQLREAYEKYMASLTPEERGEMQHSNKLNEKFETRFTESVLSNNFSFEKEYLVRVGDQMKYWDYAIYDSSGTLVMVVDLDGCYFHADKCDYNGLHSKEDRDERRGYFVPEGVKVLVIPERELTKGIETMIKMLLENYDEYIQSIFDEMRSIKFPYPTYDVVRLANSMRSLINLEERDLSLRGREGDALIFQYHRSIWHARAYGDPSPYEAWHNDELLMKCIKNRVIFQSTLNRNKILQGFNVSKIAPRVSVFSAARAKQIIMKYLPNYGTIFDPFSGFSGRMLACMAMDKQYVGQDISPIHISESKEIVKGIFVNPILKYNGVAPKLTCADSSKTTGEYPALFTCPPYGRKEQWEGVKPDSRSCDDWIDICLRNYKCNRYVFVVDKTDRYKSYVTDEITNRSHFTKSYEYVVVI